ncbi:MAG: 1-(5-phosphoribosyl)-5-[(5-phosphoribosylamino)methylideneamino]imidazole-4-carboxamide isomerase [Deltaproteobacteria bacterium]|nr:1-(5-phosphoribosyl)-5-[(5-phosphoribosylamino)methylideneamino]imidazole-4-carboxamide isomerase [Deltaproteobacteria bacterium]
MLIIPAIDIKNGRCVRLAQGRMDAETVYSENPVEVALRWEDEGAELIHLVDLDAAIEGKPVNSGVVEKIASSLKVPVQIGGGIRDSSTAERYLALKGVRRVVIGTAAYEDPGLVERLCGKYPGRIAAGIDAKDGMVAIKGWVKISDMDAFTLAGALEDRGVACIIYTDIARDGMLCGPNVESAKKLVASVAIPVIASGGVSKTEDISRLKEAGVEGVIIGKALYAGAIDLKGAIGMFHVP